MKLGFQGILLIISPKKGDASHVSPGSLSHRVTCLGTTYLDRVATLVDGRYHLFSDPWDRKFEILLMVQKSGEKTG